MTTDIEGAKKFYTELFGWAFSQHDMDSFGKYTMIEAAGQQVGGILPLPSGGAPPHWVSYISVPDLDAALIQVKALGGTSGPAMDIPKVGRFAIAHDPKGAVFAPFQGGEGPEPQGAPAPGTFCWNELLTPEQQAAPGFYGPLFGWTFDKFEVPGMPGTYLVCKRKGKEEAGVLQMPPGGEAKAHWLPYVAVEDVDRKAAQVESFGGKIWVSPADIPGVGRFAVTEDPSGAMFALFRGQR
jgi:hypothetical protein